MTIKPDKLIYFREIIDFNGTTVADLFEDISEAKVKFNKLLHEFYESHPNVMRTVEQLEHKDIVFRTFCSDYDSAGCYFEVSIVFENVNYTEELKKYNAKINEDKKKVVKKKNKNVALNELNELLKNADQDKIEKIIELLK